MITFGDGPAFAEEIPDPFAKVEYTGDLQKDASAEFEALESAYHDRRVAEDRRFRRATDSEFWVAFCFRSRSDKERFLAEWGLTDLGDKYLDGGVASETMRGRGGDAQGVEHGTDQPAGSRSRC